jgi:hypothetical protein
VSFQITTIEPIDINHINTKEEVLFHFDITKLELVLTGNEVWEWNFGDNIVQTYYKVPGATPITFNKSGRRTITLRIYERRDSVAFKAEFTADIFVYEFPKEIQGVDYIDYGSPATFTIDLLAGSNPTFKWFVNGALQNSTTNTLDVSSITRKIYIECHITNGIKTIKYKKVILVTVPNSVHGKIYESDVTPNLMFFNKEGDNLNLDYVEYEEGFNRWEGDFILHPNSSDTFKTLGLNVMEKVSPINVTAPEEDLFLKKFQLFTENGIDFEPKYTEDIKIENIISVNNQDTYYTKWIVANNIHTKFPIGSEVYFSDVYTATFDENDLVINYSLIEDFNNAPKNHETGLQTYTVVGHKRDAIMVITTKSNNIYNDVYLYGTYKSVDNRRLEIPQGTVKSLNLIKLYDTEAYNSEWNENPYKGLLYDKKKISVVNSKNNSGIYTFNYINDSSTNKLANKYIKIDTLSLVENKTNIESSGFNVDIDFKTNTILLSSGVPVDFIPYSKNNGFLNDRNILVWEKLAKKDYTPQLLKKDITFFFNDVDMLYKTIKVDTAKNLLTPQTDETQGYKLILKDLVNLAGFTFIFSVNSTLYNLKEGVNWHRGGTLDTATTNLSTAINNAVRGLACLAIAQEHEIWIWEKQNYTITNNTIVDDTIYVYQQGILTDTNPLYGVVGDEWVALNSSYHDGYIHHKKTQGIFHIAFFKDGETTPTWYILPVDKKVVWVEPTTDFTFRFNAIEDCYLTSSKIKLTQAGGDTINTVIQRFLTANQRLLLSYGIDAYVSPTDLCFARLHTVSSLNENDDYVKISLSTNGDSVGTQESKTVDLLNVLEDLKFEQNRDYGNKQNHKALSEVWSRRIIIKDIDQKFGFVLTINGIEYHVGYDNIVPTPVTPSEDIPEVDWTYDESENNIIDIEETLMDWGNQRFKLTQNNLNKSEIGRRYFEVLESLGVLVWLEKSEESYVNGVQRYDTIVLESKYPNLPITYSVNGTYNTHKILHSDVTLNEIHTTLAITINRVLYSVDYQGSVQATIEAWLYAHRDTLLEVGIIVDKLLNITTNKYDMLRFSTLQERISLKYQIYVGKNIANNEMFYITNWRTGNEGIILASNEINIVNGSDFQDEGFATGMIMSVAGSNFPLNNQEYNLILVEPTSLGLSYQGAFWTNEEIASSIPERSSFNWLAYNEEYGNSVGYNLVPNGMFNTDSWWVFNDAYTIEDSSVTVEANLGFKTPILQIQAGDYRLNFTSNDKTSEEKMFYPVMVSIFKVNGNTLSLLYQDTQSEFGDFSKFYQFDTGVYTILFANGVPGTYYNVSEISFERNVIGLLNNDLTLNTREFLRYPRERYDVSKPVQLKFSWSGEEDKSIFLYDFSGEQLNKTNRGAYQYKGITPLLDSNGNGYLNDVDNKDLTKVSEPKLQRTVWDSLIFDLKLIDSETDLSPLPTPLQVFIGYKAQDEGVNKRTLLVHRVESISLSLNTRKEADKWIDVAKFDSVSQSLTIDNNTISFLALGFKAGQRVRITGSDTSNKKEQVIFKNAGFEGVVVKSTVNQLVFRPINKKIETESSQTTTRSMIPPFRQRDAVLSVHIEVLPTEIGRFQIAGQTEIEDERFKVQLNNFGFTVNHRDVFIFKEYDINENGIDWAFLNTKRKEMLLMYPQIYNYLGSYKSLVNAINYFGYNDLELYEYYKNVDTESKDFLKLSKIEIPDIFDNKVVGYTPNDYIIKSLPDAKFEKTRLFNLTYRITDVDGNNILAYSLDEVVTKLIGLKRWLREEIMPIGTRIRDLTGRGSTLQSVDLWHDVKQSTKLKIRENISPVDFNIEGYLQPVHNGSKTFNLHLDFFTNDNSVVDYFHVKIITFAAEPDLNDPNFKLKAVQVINEYRTDLTPYNFSADRKIDPFIMVEVTCDNGYGASYTTKKTYSLSPFDVL